MGANQKNIKNIAMFTPPQLKRPTMNKISTKLYLQLIKFSRYAYNYASADFSSGGAVMEDQRGSSA